MILAIGGIGPVEIVLVLLIPVCIFLLGFFVGKKAGYIKRVKEVEKQKGLDE